MPKSAPKSASVATALFPSPSYIRQTDTPSFPSISLLYLTPPTCLHASTTYVHKLTLLLPRRRLPSSLHRPSHFLEDPRKNIRQYCVSWLPLFAFLNVGLLLQCCSSHLAFGEFRPDVAGSRATPPLPPPRMDTSPAALSVDKGGAGKMGQKGRGKGCRMNIVPAREETLFLGPPSGQTRKRGGRGDRKRQYLTQNCPLPPNKRNFCMDYP